jgi:predicted small secreted protein
MPDAPRGKDNAMRRKIALAITLATLLASAPLLSACYTTQGAGEDLSAAGRSLTNQSAEHTHYNP